MSAQVRAVVGFVHVVPVLVVVCHAFTNKFFAAVGYCWFLWELYLSCIQYSLVSHDCHLRFIMTKRLDSEKELVKNYSNAPDINLKTKKVRRGIESDLLFEWFMDFLIGRSTQEPGTSMCRLLDSSVQSYLGFPRLSYRDQNQWFWLLRCGRWCFVASSRSG